MTMELPDEAISYDYRALLVPPEEYWTPAAEMRQRHFLTLARLKEFSQRLLQCRSQVAAEREMRLVPEELKPLEPGFIDLPEVLLSDLRRKGEASVVGRVLAVAGQLREEADRVVILSSGGPYLAARGLFRALRGHHHNERPTERRLGIPRIYFAGHDADNDSLQDLLDLLQDACVDPDVREERWAVVVISKRGESLETAVAHRVFRREATEYYGLRSEYLIRLFKAVAGEQSLLRDVFHAWGHPPDDILTIPDNVGERWSVFTPAGLLPAALMGLDIRAMLLGAQAMSKRFIEETFEGNPVLQFAGVNHLLHKEHDKSVRELAVWSDKLEGIGEWYAHLLAASLGKTGLGPTPMVHTLTRDLVAWNQHYQEGARDRLVINWLVQHSTSLPITVQMADHNEDDINHLCRRTLQDMTNTALQSMSMACFDSGRPMANLVLPVLTEHTLGQLLQMLMLATVLEARLLGVNPYNQPSVDACDSFRHELLKQMSGSSSDPG
jgi:glucose-6-phosphate isomerase